MVTPLIVSVAAGLAAPPPACSGRLVDSGQMLQSEFGGGTAVALGDFDGDGDLDAFVPHYVAPIVLWRNLGNAVFVPTDPPFGGSLSGRLLSADFDGDGDVDVFIINHSFQTTVWHNDGAGRFTSGQNLGSASSHSADAGDLDGDGDLDVFVGYLDGHWNTSLLNDGTGVFVWGDQNHPLPARAVALGDLDGDGDLDAFLARADNGPQPNGVLFGRGDGTFIDSGQSLGLEYSTDVELADLDGDGDLDALVASADLFDSDPVDTIWLNDGRGLFADSGQRLGEGLSTWDIAIGDFDCDGDVDAYAPHTNGTPTLYVNNGVGVFAEVQVAGAGGGLRSAVGDLDGDGDLDVFNINSNGPGTVLINRGTGPLPSSMMQRVP